MKYRVLVEQDEDGVYVTEALANIKGAIELDLDSLEAHGEPVTPSISEEIVGHFLKVAPDAVRH
jgi:predicted RNase H-like HicB family nuclease